MSATANEVTVEVNYDELIPNNVDPKGWAKFGHVKMPEYRWGILLAPKEEGRTSVCRRLWEEA